MKKVFYVFAILVLFFVITSVPSFAATVPLDSVTTSVDKEKITPGEEVTLTVNFGKEMGSYTVNAAYDNAIFEYVSAKGGTANDTGDKVILSFHDSGGGTSPSSEASITFKAKEGLNASNPTDFSVTLEGMANNDASERYDDILIAIVEDVLVEPKYVDYTLSLEYTGNIKQNEQKDMKLITESSMGKNYDHVRLIAEVIAKPSEDATAKLLAMQDDMEIDLIQSGWGEAEGYAIGGKDVRQELLLRGEFSTIGEYTIDIRLIDRDDSDTVIVEKSFDITVGEETTQTPSEEETGTEKPNTQNPSTEGSEPQENLPEAYPQTGIMQYAIVAIAIIGLISIYVALIKSKKDLR